MLGCQKARVAGFVNVVVFFLQTRVDVPECPDTRGNIERSAREIMAADIMLDMAGLIWCMFEMKKS